MENNISIAGIAELIESWDDILIITHASPDADTVGSAFALKYAYSEKNIRIVSSDPIPKRLDFICDGSPTDIPAHEYDHVMTVDSAELHLTGEAGCKYADRIELKIDHHRTSTEYARYNYTDEGAGACGEIIFRVLKAANRLNERAAYALYAAIASDTGCFRFRNVTANTHITIAELIGYGIDFGGINSLLFENKSKAEISATKAALDSLEYYYGGRVAMISLTNDVKNANGIDDDSMASVNSLAREIEGVDLGITLKEKTERPGSYKVSMRSSESIDCSAICGILGGGGHLRASGATVTSDSLENAKQTVMNAVAECIGNE